jgi:hypothetical protein
MPLLVVLAAAVDEVAEVSSAGPVPWMVKSGEELAELPRMRRYDSRVVRLVGRVMLIE